MGTVVLVVVAVGGVSVSLAIRILRNNAEVVTEYGHILKLDEIGSRFDELVFELHQLDATNASSRTTHALLAHEDLIRQLDVLARLHRDGPGSAEAATSAGPTSELVTLVDEAGALARRMAASGRFSERDILWLDRAKHVLPRELEALARLHQARVAQRLDENDGLIRAIVALYVAFLIGGGTLLAVAGVAVERSVTAPLRRLAAASIGIAEGRLDARVPVRQADEIGQLSRSFNVMADRLQAHEQELRAAQSALEEKVRQTEALYRVGNEIARLQQVDRILQSVADRARELLHGDAAALCLCAVEDGRLLARATSGPAEAFDRETAEPCAPLPGGGGTCDGPPSPIIRPDFARSHVAAPLRVGDEELGTIHVSSREERTWSDGEAAWLAGLAVQAAGAIERARLSEELRRVAAAEERERIAREMHDGLAQALGLIHLKLQWAAPRAADPALAETLSEMARVADGAYQDVRQSIFELRTFVSRGLGLVPTLTEYLHEFSARSGIPVELEVGPGDVGRLTPANEVQAVRVIQEALNNVSKHSGARRARVSLRPEGGGLSLAIEDDGSGWDSARPTDPRHFGVQMMRERAQGLGGSFRVETQPGGGTRVVATFPGPGE